MADKVLMYDANDVKVGEIFTRRARQLVKQQRAIWTDDSQDAIRFAPDLEEDFDFNSEDMAVSVEVVDEDEARLARLAWNRASSRYPVRIHGGVLLCLSLFLTAIYVITNFGGYFWPIWPILVFSLSIGIHGFIVYTNNRNEMEDFQKEYDKLRKKFSHL